MRPVRFGLDFGTSNTALAVSEGGRARVLPLDAVAGESMPTVLYVRRDGTTHVGRAAIDAFLRDNADRGPIKREFKMLGIRVASSDKEQPTVEAHIMTDVSSPGRLFQSLKTFLGDALLGDTNVFGDAKGLSDLIAIVLEQVRSRAKELTGRYPDDITFGRPVEFVGGTAVEERALGRLRDAAGLAGFKAVRFELEPVAAARAADVAQGHTLVFDFGGGTLDLCVTERSGDDLRVLATAGTDVGGDRMTQLLIDEAVAPALGSTATWGEKRLRLPNFIVNAIGDWRALSALNEKSVLDALDNLIRAAGAGAPDGGGAPPKRELSALRSAIELQLGYEIFAAVDRLKCELSDTERAVFTFHRAAVDVDRMVTRRRFEKLVTPQFARVDALIDQVLERAGLPAARIAEVVCTGGSSAIPTSRALLARRFPGAIRRDAALFSSVASGLALS